MPEIKTVKEKAFGEYSEKRSRFIAQICPAKTEEEALEIISAVKARYHDAKHNVFAFALSDGTVKYSDDGEPHGTAGKPLSDIISGADLSDVVITVTRYFGGVLLGPGGLMRAYQQAAKNALNSAEFVTLTLMTECSVRCDYAQANEIKRLITESGAVLTNINYGEFVEIDFAVKKEAFETFEHSLNEKFYNKISVNVGKEKFFSL